MLDLSTIPVVDNHCHPILRQQHLDLLHFRSLFTEGTASVLAEQHVPNSVYYRWMLRQMATFHGCDPAEETVLAARNSHPADELLARLLAAARIDTLIIDTGYPPAEQCYTPSQIGRIGGCRVARLLRLETLMEQLIVAYNDFDEVIARLASAVDRARAQGYCSLKSIVAYRTGLEIVQWRKDEAAASFAEARQAANGDRAFRLAHKPLLDYLLHIAFGRASEQQLPVQFHTGYGDGDTDMRLGNPLHLRAVLNHSDYQGMPVVLLHESYPYCQFGAYLAAIYPQVYFDLSYTIPFLERLEMLAFTRQALSVAPASKLMCSSDGIYVPEMHWAGALRARSVIGQVLQEMIEADEIDEALALTFARMILHDTAGQFYHL